MDGRADVISRERLLSSFKAISQPPTPRISGHFSWELSLEGKYVCIYLFLMNRVHSLGTTPRYAQVTEGARIPDKQVTETKDKFLQLPDAFAEIASLGSQLRHWEIFGLRGKWPSQHFASFLPILQDSGSADPRAGRDDGWAGLRI